MRGALLPFLVRRSVHAALLVLVAASAAFVLVQLAPGGPFGFEADPAHAAAERARLGLDRPLAVQYVDWLARAATLDFGESIRFGRPVSALIGERIGGTLLLGITALALALAAGLPAGVLTASAPSRPAARAVRGLSLLLVSVPPLVTSLVLLLVAARTGLLPASGRGLVSTEGALDALAVTALYLPLPALALALPTAASLERVQSRAMVDALAEPSIRAARARGIPIARTVWVHAWRLSLPPVLGLLAIVSGSILSGSFVVEIVMSWPGLGDLMYQALIARDMYLAGGCAAAGALLLACGITASELALHAADPRRQEAA